MSRNILDKIYARKHKIEELLKSLDGGKAYSVCQVEGCPVVIGAELDRVRASSLTEELDFVNSLIDEVLAS